MCLIIWIEVSYDINITTHTFQRQPLSGRCEDKPVHDIVNETVELLKKK